MRFSPIGDARPGHPYRSGSRIFKGELVVFRPDGSVGPYREHVHVAALGVAASDADDGEVVVVYDDPEQEFICRASVSE